MCFNINPNLSKNLPEIHLETLHKWQNSVIIVSIRGQISAKIFRKQLTDLFIYHAAHVASFDNLYMYVATGHMAISMILMCM